MNIEEKIRVMQAYAGGEEIEFKAKFNRGHVWTFTSHPIWDWATNDYRIKPQKKTGWINILKRPKTNEAFPSARIYDDYSEAVADGTQYKIYLTTIPIEWEEK